MRITLVSLLGLTLATGCTTMIDGWSSSNVEGGTTSAAGHTYDWKIEGSQIGQEGLVMHLGDRTVTFFDWVDKTGSNGEYVGFSIKLTGTDVLGYNVKSSGEVVHSTMTTWIAAGGPDGGSQSPGISNIDFGENCTDGSCADGSDGGDDGGGSGSDGCIEGCDDGTGTGGDGSGSGGDGGDGSGGGDGTVGTDGGGGDGDCFEPGGCNGPTLPPPVSDGDDGTGGCIEGCDDGSGGAVLL